MGVWRWSASVLLAVGALAACSDPADLYEDYGLLGDAAPSFTLANEAAPLPSQGGPTVLHFWGLWCAECFRDERHVEALRAAIGAIDGAEMLDIHVGETGHYASVDEYFAEIGHEFPVIMDPAGAIGDLYEVIWYPSYIVVDAEGVITHAQTSLRFTGGPDAVLEALYEAAAGGD